MDTWEVAPAPEPQQGDFLNLFLLTSVSFQEFIGIHTLLGSVLDCFLSMQRELNFLWVYKITLYVPRSDF